MPSFSQTHSYANKGGLFFMVARPVGLEVNNTKTKAMRVNYNNANHIIVWTNARLSFSKASVISTA